MLKMGMVFFIQLLHLVITICFTFSTSLIHVMKGNYFQFATFPLDLNWIISLLIEVFSLCAKKFWNGLIFRTACTLDLTSLTALFKLSGRTMFSFKFPFFRLFTCLSNRSTNPVILYRFPVAQSNFHISFLDKFTLFYRFKCSSMGKNLWVET